MVILTVDQLVIEIGMPGIKIMDGMPNSYRKSRNIDD